MFEISVNGGELPLDIDGGSTGVLSGAGCLRLIVWVTVSTRVCRWRGQDKTNSFETSLRFFFLRRKATLWQKCEIMLKEFNKSSKVLTNI